MIVSLKQVLYMFAQMQRFEDAGEGPFTFDKADLQALHDFNNTIINQQSDKLLELNEPIPTSNK